MYTTEVGEEAVRRVMTETLRAAAVSNWLWTGDLEIPVPLRSLHVALCGAEKTYHKWVRYSRDRQNDDVKIDMELVSCSRAGYEIYRPQTEVRWMVTAIEDYLICTSVDAFGCRIQPVLFGGHLHWLCLSYLREPGPWHLFSQADLKKGTAGTARMTAERKRLMGLKRESLSGLRAWMMYLVNGAEDPPWQKAILDEIGRIEDDEDLLLKATSMAAFLQERGEFNKLASKTRKVIGSDAKRRVAMLDALGRPFAGLERQWREWLLPGRGVAQRLSAKRGN